MSQASRVVGLAGTLIVAIGYLPQIVHLAKERCSAGLSLRAWLLWLLGSALVFLHALAVRDVVFITIQTINMLAMLLIIVLCKRFTNMICATHRLAALEAIQSAAPR